MYIWGRVGPRVGSGWVRLFVGNRGSGRVGSTFRRVGSGRVQEKWPVDNSVTYSFVSNKFEIDDGDHVVEESIRDAV